MVARAVAELEAAPDTDVEALARKEERWEDLLDSDAYRHQKLVADAWCAAFVWPKQPGPLQDAAPTNEVWLQIRDRRGQPTTLTVKTTEELAEQYHFFHWHLAFPQVFARGGFDVVLGNPPWERVKLQEEEWFAERAPEIAEARNAAARKRQINDLKTSHPDFLVTFQSEQRMASGQAAILTNSSRFPLCGRGDVNTYSVFAELGCAVLSPAGICGMVVPPGILTDDTNKVFARELVEARRLHSFLSFTNRGYTFAQVESTMSFSLLVVGRQGEGRFRIAGQLWSVNGLRDSSRVYELGVADVTLFNPNTRNLPVFRSARDMQIVRSIYERFPVIENEEKQDNSWNVELGTMFHMASASKDFKSRSDLELDGWVLVGNRFIRGEESYIPLYESKLAHQFNHRHATFGEFDEGEALFRRRARTGKPSLKELQDPEWAPIPRYWLPLESVRNEATGKKSWLLVYRRTINAVADARSVVATVLPLVGVGDSLFLVRGLSAHDACVFSAMLNSFVFDYVTRQKATGGNLSFYVLKQLPVVPPTGFDESARQFIVDRVLELTVTTNHLLPFAVECGYSGGPFRWNADRRLILRAEIDAMFLRLFGFSRDDAEYLLDFFEVVCRRDERELGEYRTKRLILEIYDAMAEAARTGQSYATRLDPPPADPRVAHPPRTDIVVPFPSRPFVPPVWGLELFAEVAARAQVGLGAGAWGTSLSGVDLGTAALAAVLRNLPGPRAREDVERAVVLALLPRLMLPKFDSMSANTWSNVIGRENLNVTSVGAFGIPWSIVIRKAIQQNVLSEETNGLWRAGPGVTDAPSPEFDARTLVVLSWLATAPAKDGEVTKQMEYLHVA